MTIETKLKPGQSVEAFIDQLPEPPANIQQGIIAFYQRIDPRNEHSSRIPIDSQEEIASGLLHEERTQRLVFTEINAQLFQEARVRLSWRDLENYQTKGYQTVTELGTLLNSGCATLDSTTGEIKITERVSDGNKAKQAVVDYILAKRDADGSWLVGGVKRRRTADMTFQSGSKQ